MRQTILILVLAAIITNTISCQPLDPGLSIPENPDAMDTPVVSPTEQAIEWVESESLTVESVDVLIMESWPLQVNAVVKGYLPDGCTNIYQSSSHRYGQGFRINLVTRRPKDALCTEALELFEVIVPLDVSGLPAGNYQVDAYGVQADFTFQQDNIIPRPSS